MPRGLLELLPSVSVTLTTYVPRNNRGRLDRGQGRLPKLRVWVHAGRSSDRAFSDADAVIQTTITDQCALFARPEDDFRVDPLVTEGQRVAQGAPVLRSRRHRELVLVAPVAGEVAALDLGPGRRLSHMLFFHAPDAGRHEHARPKGVEADAAALRALLLSAGMWPLLRSRPFGRAPLPAEIPAAIFVMAIDTRPGAPSVRLALEGREEHFSRGLRAIGGLTGGPLAVCQDDGPDLPVGSGPAGRLHLRRIAPRHPLGLAGLQILEHFPAEIGKSVWDIDAEDVAAIGELLATGLVAETRLVSVSGPALRESRLARCQPGADLRALTFDIVRPGPHRLLSGSPVDGTEGRWLGPRHRQVTAVPPAERNAYPHWFSAALRRAGRPLPIIPTAALEQAFGGRLPAAPLARAIASNDAETATRLGLLSLVEDDVALADYVTGASPRLPVMLRAMLDRIAREEAQ